jgi:alkaline phosphatase D
MSEPRLTRRTFVTRAGSLAAAATVLGPQVALGNGSGSAAAPTLDGRFAEGVMSGDPKTTAITLWTRLADAGGTGTVELEISTDPDFRRTVARRLLSTREAIGHSVKARIKGLDPYEQYFYRFATRDADSPVGRFRTALPHDSRQPVRFAVFSCQEYTFGYYNAHALMAREDLDFVINLGDYIYSDISFRTPTGVRNADFTTSVQPSATTLSEYRERYSTYRSDSALRKMHAAFPLISVWDDHEVQNNYAGGAPGGGDVSGEYSVGRRNTAYRAFFESMPTFAIGRRRLYHRASFGSMVDLYVLDERQYRAAQPRCEVGAPCPELDEPRAFLGESQLDFVRSGIGRSKAAWKVIANAVPIMPLKKDESDPGYFDGWEGYPVEREALLRTVRDAGDVVFVTGDYHAFISGDVKTRDEQTVAAEFVGGSITTFSDTELRAIGGAPGFGTPDDPKVPASYVRAQREANGRIFDDLDYIHHGYVTCRASTKSFKATFKKLETVRRRTTDLAEVRSWKVRRGVPGLPR